MTGSAVETREADVRRALAEPCTAYGYTVAAVSFAHAVEITLEKAGATFVVWLKPASDTAAAYQTTVRFKIGYRGDPPDRLGYALLDAACAQIRVWEQSLTDDDAAQLLDAQPRPPAGAALRLEWIAVRCGLKPAARDVVDADGGARLVDQAHAIGLHVRTTDASAYIGRFSAGVERGLTTIVYVARTAEAAAAAADAERAMIDASSQKGRVSADHVRAVGLALGYPPCCIDAFTRINHRPNGEIKFHALRRTAERASLMLNDLLETSALVSHLVCRYDCPESIRYARALVQELGAEAARDLERRLGGLMVCFRRGGVLRLASAALVGAGVYRFAAVEASGQGTRFERWRTALHGADGIQVSSRSVRVLRAGETIRRLFAPPRHVQIRLFE